MSVLPDLKTVFCFVLRKSYTVLGKRGTIT